MLKELLGYWLLYFYSLYKFIIREDLRVPEGHAAVDVIYPFYDKDSDDPEKPHAVAVFVFEEGEYRAEEWRDVIYTPLGHEKDIELYGYKLAGRDKWGEIKKYMIYDPRNGKLRNLANQYKGKTIILAGVRSWFGIIPIPLNNPDLYIMLRK